MTPLAERNEHWPYTDSEAAKIRNYFDPPNTHALGIAVNAARNFVDLFDRNRKKANVRAQVQRLGEAVTELRLALSDLSTEAENHLKRYRRHPAAEISAPWSPADGVANDPVKTGELHALLHRFAYENEPCLKKTRADERENKIPFDPASVARRINATEKVVLDQEQKWLEDMRERYQHHWPVAEVPILPPITSAGPVEQKLEKSLIREFKQAFLAGHRLAEGRYGQLTRPRTGWPAFRALCRDPLVQMKLLVRLDIKSLQDKTGRNNRPQNATK